MILRDQGETGRVLQEQGETKRELQVYSRKRRGTTDQWNEVPLHYQSSPPNMVKPENSGEYIQG